MHPLKFGRYNAPPPLLLRPLGDMPPLPGMHLAFLSGVGLLIASFVMRMWISRSWMQRVVIFAACFPCSVSARLPLEPVWSGHHR